MSRSQIQVTLRCGRCRRAVGKLERWPGRWTPDDAVLTVTSDDSRSIVTWPCKNGRCGYRPLVNGRKLLAAADRAHELGLPLVLGAPNYGLPSHSADTL